MALASNTNPHSIGGGVVMSGCVVLVSNLNEKVQARFHKLLKLNVSYPYSVLFVILISSITDCLFSHYPGFLLNSNLLSLQDDYSSCSLHSLWYVLTIFVVM